MNASNPVTQIFQHVIHLDARGLPIEEIDGLGNSVHKGFDSRRLLTYFADANQHEFFRDYDLFGQPVALRTQIAGSQLLSKLFYDYSKRTTTAISPINGTTNWIYDNLNRLESIQRDGRSMVHEYDKQNNLIKRTDENGLVTRYQYSPSGLVERVEHDLSRLYCSTQFSFV